MMKLYAVLYVVLNTGGAPVHTVEIPGTYKDCASAVAQSKATFIPGMYPGGALSNELRLGFLCVPAK